MDSSRAHPFLLILTLILVIVQYSHVQATTTPSLTKHSRAFDSQPTSSTTEAIEAESKPTSVDGAEISSFCNDPGKPPMSQISPVQLSYTDGETVVYTCNNFISLKQYRKCIHGKWHGDTPVCGDAFRKNDMTRALFYDRDTLQLTAEYNVSGRLEPFDKFGNSFIAERIPSMPVRGHNASNYYIEIYIQKPAMIQMVRVSFSVVNHLTDPLLRNADFSVDHVAVSRYRECNMVNNNSVSPWHFNSTRFDYWFFCRSKSQADFNRELTDMSRLLTMETRARTSLEIDLATFILAEQYSNNGNRSDPICGLPEVPVGLESKVINDQTNYAFSCAKNFRQMDTFGGQFHLRKCGYDLRWHGELPKCVPTKTCSKFNLGATNFLVEVFKYDRIYFSDENDWLLIPGSRAFFKCKDETHIFVGKEIRVCGEDGEWSNSMPNCLVSALSATNANANLNTNNIVIIVLATLIVTFLLSSCTIFFFLKLRSSPKPQPNQLELNEAAYYASSQIDPISGKLVDDTYEVLEPFDQRYASAYHPQANANPLLLKTSPFEVDGGNDSYTCIQDYNTGYPVPAPRSLATKPQENEYYDDTVMDSPIEAYQDSYQVMRKA